MKYARRILLLLIFLALGAGTCSCSQQPLYPPPPVEGSYVSVDVAFLKDEVPLFYTYRSGDRNVNFFILSLNGRILSFLDACVTCYPKKRGYRDDHGYVVCRACNISFSIYKLEKGIGGCYPIKIEGRTENGRYLIPVKTLESNADRF